MNNLPATEKMIAVIDELYIRQAGPFGAMVCEDALATWKERYQQSHFLHLPDYIDLLADELPSRKLKVDFIGSLKKVQVLASQSTIKAYLSKY